MPQKKKIKLLKTENNNTVDKNYNLLETVNTLYKLGLCSKEVHDFDIYILKAMHLEHINGPAEELNNLLVMIHDYMFLCSTDLKYTISKLEDANDTEYFCENKKPYSDA